MPVSSSVSIGPDSGKICEDGEGGFVLPLFADEQNWSRGGRGLIYGVLLVYFFLGVSIIADIFMGAIEVITSRRRQVMLMSGRMITVRVWNDTVANLTLMALGSSAPEILLAVTELFKRKMFSGELGPSTIVGSASFNLLVIIALCIFVIPATEFRRVREVPVFLVTILFMLFAYLWLVLTVSVISPGIIEIWEAAVTLTGLPSLVWVSYLADIGKLGQFDCMRREGKHRIKASDVNRCCELLGSYDRETKEAIRMGLQVQPQALRKLEHPTSSDMEDLRRMVKGHMAVKHSRAARRIEITRQMTGSRRVANMRPTFFFAARVSGMTGASVLDVPLALAKGAGWHWHAYEKRNIKHFQEGVLQESVFGVFFGNDGEQSEITFGSYKKEQMATEVFWAPITVPGYWQVAMDDITLDNKNLGFCSGDHKCQVAVDTGTSLLAGPSEIVSALVEKLQVADDCSNLQNLPDLGFIVGDHILNLKAEDYVAENSDRCSLGLMSLDVPPPKGPLFIFGDPFLRKYYTVYDRQNMRVGFALAAHKPVPPGAALLAMQERHRQVHTHKHRRVRHHFFHK